MSTEIPKRRGRLLWTLLAVIVLVSVIPLLVSNFFQIGENRDSLETLEKKYLTRSAVSIATEVENIVWSYSQQLIKIAGGLQTDGTSAPGTDPFASPTLNDLIAKYTSSDPNLLALKMMSQQGTGARGEPAGLNADVVEEMNRGIRAALNGATYVGRFQYVAVVNQPALVIAVPVADSTGVIGAVEALVSLKRIGDRLEEERKGGVTAFVVDRSTGQVLMHSDPSISIQRPLFANLKIVQEFMKAPVRVTESYEDVNAGNVKVIGTVAPVAGLEWGVIAQKAEAQAFASVEKMTQRMILWSAIALVLAVVLGSIFATQISKPIRTLADRTREIASGDYKQRAEVTARNEIGELADHFNVMSAEIEKSIEQLKKAANENHLLFINSVRMLAAAIDAKDPYTRGHSERVARYSIAIGKHLNLPPDQMRNLRISALLHDVGKIGIDDRILRKPGALSDDEFEVMKTHPDKGAAIMAGVAQLIDIIPGMKYHHEKWAGGGYPDGLKGEQIPMQARIVAIADTFDAMTTNRPYQKAMELSYVTDKILSFGGTRFDPAVVDAFVRAVKAGDITVEEQVRGAA